MLMLKVLAHPLNKVVLENTFDELVEEVRCYQFMDVCAGKMLGEWLGGGVRVSTSRETGLARLDLP